MPDTVESFSAMLRAALGRRLAADATSFLDMVAEDVVMEFPYAPPGLPRRLAGKAAIAEHLGIFATRIALDGVGEPTVHGGADPDFVTLEFTGRGRGIATGEPYEQRYVSLIRTSKGRIVHYRDYWDPLALLRALEGPSIVPAISTGWRIHG